MRMSRAEAAKHALTLLYRQIEMSAAGLTAAENDLEVQRDSHARYVAAAQVLARIAGEPEPENGDGNDVDA